jgi:uncharacterized protein YbjQ (UPF0145 family)
VVRSPSYARQAFGGLKPVIGGNVESYTRACEEARREAFNRMVAQATEVNADAIIGMRYDATEFAPLFFPGREARKEMAI